MALIKDLEESWSDHTFSEIEFFIKSELKNLQDEIDELNEEN